MDSTQSPAMGVKGFFALLISGLLAGLVGIYLFNSTINPYLEFRTDLHMNGIEDLNPRARDMKRTLLERYDEPPQAIVLGNSRAMSFPPDLIEQETGFRSFNAAVNYGSVYDLLAFTRYFLDEVSSDLKLVIANIDSFMFYGEPDEELTQYFWMRYLPELGLDENEAWRGRLRHAMSLHTTGDSLTLLFDTLRGASITLDYADDGLHKLSYTGDPVNDHGLQYVEEMTISYQGNYGADDPWQLNPIFQAWLKLLAEHETCVIIISPPLHPDLIALLESTSNYTRDIEALNALMVELQTTYPFEFYDFSRVELFDGDPQAFRDPAHSLKPNVDQMLTQALQSSECLDSLQQPDM